MTGREDIKARVEVMTAWLEGKRLQFRPLYETGTLGWRDFHTNMVPKFKFDFNQYRVRPLQPDLIEWSHVSPKFKFMARDKDGSAYLYEVEPSTTGFAFYAGDSAIGTADDYDSYRRGEVDWSDSLVKRPEAV